VCGVDEVGENRSKQEGRAEIGITYRFGPPSGSDAEPESLSLPHFKNGNRS
jgi:hypothetical protein